MTTSRRYVWQSVVSSLLSDHRQTAAIGRMQLSLQTGRGLKRKVEFSDDDDECVGESGRQLNRMRIDN
jgi:hypothetical protein